MSLRSRSQQQCLNRSMYLLHLLTSSKFFVLMAKEIDVPINSTSHTVLAPSFSTNVEQLQKTRWKCCLQVLFRHYGWSVRGTRVFSTSCREGSISRHLQSLPNLQIRLDPSLCPATGLSSDLLSSNVACHPILYRKVPSVMPITRKKHTKQSASNLRFQSACTRFESAIAPVTPGRSPYAAPSVILFQDGFVSSIKCPSLSDNPIKSLRKAVDRARRDEATILTGTNRNANFVSAMSFTHISNHSALTLPLTHRSQAQANSG